MLSLNPENGFLVYTDGSCSAQDRLGAWAWLAVDSNGKMEGYGSNASDTTISRMELCAPIRALATIFGAYGPSVVLVMSDSEYVVKGITDRTRNRNAHHDLWEYLDTLVDWHEIVDFTHVYGHTGDELNEWVDGECTRLRNLMKEGKKSYGPIEIP